MSPTIIAFLRGHKNLIPIALLNIFLSFTFIGYFVSLIWCFSDNINKRRINLKDWQILLIFGVLSSIIFAIFTKNIVTYSNDIVKFIQVYSFDFDTLNKPK